MNLVRFALVGTGMVSEYHRQAIASLTEDEAALSVVVHHDPTRFPEISRRWGVPCVSYEEALRRSDVDAVSICTPSGQHAAQAIAAAEAGKHVLVEKPMALSVADCDRMIEACDRAGVRLGVVFQRRAEPLFRRVKEAVESGDLGALTTGLITLPYLRTQAYYDSAAWRGTWALDGGGILMNQGIHLIDLLLWYMGNPVGIQAYAATRFRQIEVEDVAAATLQFDTGAYATITATTTAEPGFPHRLELFGTAGGIQIEGENVVRWSLVHPEKAAVPPFETGPASTAGSGGDPRGIALTGHTGIIRDFVDAIRQGRRPMVDGFEGRRSIETILSIYSAAGLHRPL